MTIEHLKPCEIDAMMGSVLMEKRISKRKTLKELAELSGISFQQIQKYEKGNNRISISRLFGLCAILEVRPSDLLLEVESMVAESVSDDNPVDVESEFLKTYSGQRAFSSLAAIDDKALLKALLNLITEVQKKRKPLNL